MPKSSAAALESFPYYLDNAIFDALGDNGVSIYEVSVGIFSASDPAQLIESHTVAAASDKDEDTNAIVIRQAIEFCQGYFGSRHTYAAIGKVRKIFDRENIKKIKLAIEHKDGTEIESIFNALANVYPTAFPEIHCQYRYDDTWQMGSKVIHSSKMVALWIKNMYALSAQAPEQFQ
jgi:hypothetical protein